MSRKRPGTLLRGDLSSSIRGAKQDDPIEKLKSAKKLCRWMSEYLQANELPPPELAVYMSECLESIASGEEPKKALNLVLPRGRQRVSKWTVMENANSVINARLLHNLSARQAAMRVATSVDGEETDYRPFLEQYNAYAGENSEIIKALFGADG